MNLSQPSPGQNMASYDFPPYTHTQPFLPQIGEENLAQKRCISPESQVVQHYPLDKRLRHNSLEYLLDMNPQQSQPTFIRKVCLEDLMRGIDNITANTLKKEDISELATKQDLLNLEGNVKAQAMELHQLKLAFNKQQGEINALRETVDGNCAAILASDRSADRPPNVGHRMFISADRPTQNTSTPMSKRFNLVIEGVPDIPLPEIYSYVIELADKLKVTIFKRDISNITRISRRVPSVAGAKRQNPGPVVVVFVHTHLRDAILRNKIDLKDMEKYRKVYVNPDDSFEVRRQKSHFRRIAYLARMDGQTVSYRSGSIRIGDTEYKISELSNIPDKYIPKDDHRPTPMEVPSAPVLPTTDQQKATGIDAQPNVTENDAQPDEAPPVENPNRPAQVQLQLSGRTQLRGGNICFSGATSFLSNFFLVCFIYCNIKYKSLEQCYHHTHALMAKAFDLAKEIYEETDGVELKNLSKRIPYCAEWAIVSEPKMDEMLECKFGQNQDLMDQLIHTAPYELVEASVDKKWGGGEPWASPKYDSGTFPGENKFGARITKYRDVKIALLNAPN